MYRTEHHCPRADGDIIANGGTALARVADGHILIDGEVLAHTARMDDGAVTMLDEETALHRALVRAKPYSLLRRIHHLAKRRDVPAAHKCTRTEIEHVEELPTPIGATHQFLDLQVLISGGVIP